MPNSMLTDEAVAQQPPTDPALEAANADPNNYQLPENVQTELKRLVDKFTLEDAISRREEVKQIRKAREFWRDRQYLYWSQKDQTWKMPFPTPQADGADPVFQYTTNIYKAYGSTFIGAITQNPPRVRFWPQSPSQREDVETARAASDIAELVERNNKSATLLQDEAFYLWTDGTVCSYVRYVVDGEQFGYDEIPVLEEQTTFLEDGTPTVVPVQTGTQKLPKGQEVIDVFGRLEVKLPNYAKQMSEFPYLQLATEIHKTKLCSIYPHAASKIKAGDAGTSEDSYERNARIGLTTGTQDKSVFGGNTEHSSLVTFRRTWLRPWVFTDCNDEMRQKLETLFPSGVYVAFAGDTYCEARDECMDYYWKVCHGTTGDGQMREAIGNSLISLQERYNTLSNIMQETYEYTIPTTFYAARAIDGEAWNDSGNRPGARLPVAVQPGESISALVDTTKAGTPPESLVQYASEMLGPVAQFVTGLFPALFGAEAGNETASGYAMQRDQAMGRIGLVYRRLREFHADTMMLAVECFRKNRTQDIEMSVLGPAGDIMGKMIHLDQLKGSIYAYPETDEDYPISWTQRKNTYTDLANTQNPYLQGVFATPANLAELNKTLNLKGLVLPGENARSQQYREIDQLLASAAIDVPMADPMSGIEVPQRVTSVPVDPILDNHQVHLQTIQEFAESSEGQLAKEQNPVGFENVRMHAMQHQMFLMQQQQQAMAAQQPAGEDNSPREDEAPQGSQESA